MHVHHEPFLTCLCVSLWANLSWSTAHCRIFSSISSSLIMSSCHCDTLVLPPNTPTWGVFFDMFLPDLYSASLLYVYGHLISHGHTNTTFRLKVSQCRCIQVTWVVATTPPTFAPIYGIHERDSMSSRSSYSTGPLYSLSSYPEHAVTLSCETWSIIHLDMFTFTFP